jgi:hypothetical protein
MLLMQVDLRNFEHEMEVFNQNFLQKYVLTLKRFNSISPHFSSSSHSLIKEVFNKQIQENLINTDFFNPDTFIVLLNSFLFL